MIKCIIDEVMLRHHRKKRILKRDENLILQSFLTH